MGLVGVCKIRHINVISTRYYTECKTQSAEVLGNAQKAGIHSGMVRKLRRAMNFRDFHA